MLFGGVVGGTERSTYNQPKKLISDEVTKEPEYRWQDALDIETV